MCALSDRNELRRLKKENYDLKRKLYKLETKVHAEEEAKLHDNKGFEANNYFSFLLSKLKRKNFYSLFKRIAKYCRNSLWLTGIFRFGLLLYQYLQAGAFFLIYTAVFILFIPITLSVALIILIITLILRDRNRKTLIKQLQKEIVFIVPANKEAFDRIEIEETIEKNADKTVLLITPFFLKKRGIGDSDNMFVCYRKERENVFILRRYFFFYFRKCLRKEQTFKTEEIFISEK